MTNAPYLLVADLLGFSRIVNNLSIEALDARMLAWTTLVDATARTHGLDKLQLISDTLFVGSDASEIGLLKLIAFSRELLAKGLEQSFPIRGAIVRGPYEWGKLTYGRAVIAAHNLEQAQNWVGVTCDSSVFIPESMWSLEQLICYPAPLKRAPLRLYPVVSWRVPPTEQLLKLMTTGGLSRPKETLTWELGEKVNNTVLFRMYQELLLRTSAPCSKFHGMLPVHPIETMLLGQ